jgi:hypothetical protein
MKNALTEANKAKISLRTYEYSALQDIASQGSVISTTLRISRN